MPDFSWVEQDLRFLADFIESDIDAEGTVGDELVGPEDMLDVLLDEAEESRSPDPADSIGRLWDEARSSGELDEADRRRVLTRLWETLRGVEDAAEERRVKARPLVDALREHPDLVDVSSDLEERVQRAATGLFQSIEQTLPRTLRRAGEATLRIDWAQGRAHWIGHEGEQGLDVRLLASECAGRFGELGTSAQEALAEALMQGLREGALTTSRFALETDQGTTTDLSWRLQGVARRTDLAGPQPEFDMDLVAVEAEFAQTAPQAFDAYGALLAHVEHARALQEVQAELSRSLEQSMAEHGLTLSARGHDPRSSALIRFLKVLELRSEARKPR